MNAQHVVAKLLEAGPDDFNYMDYIKSMPPIEAIEVQGRRWFRRGPGNTYFTARIYVNDKLVHTLPVQYGYGNHYLDVAFDWLDEHGYINLGKNSNGSRRDQPWNYCKDHGIKLSYEAVDVSTRRDL